MKMSQKRKPMRKKRLWMIPVLAVIALCAAFFIYTEVYCHADETARAALRSDETVTVTQTGYGWLFDGPSEEDALIFYPGGKVEETAYAPLLRRLAGQGMDVCLVKMPFRLAVFGMNKADDVMKQHHYAHWYIGGHSLGGVMAADYASAHRSQFSGVILLAAYPSKPMDPGTRAITIYGSEDGVLNRAKLVEAKQYLPEDNVTCVIDGGNHAQFGNYGKQAGDGKAAVSAEEQQRSTVEYILMNKRAE